ncbi:alpha/beta fold hydrolase [Brevibacterium metallidurans]|uniref:AB hydrolase-1 domain-containing protein n=1 Tax=Brevibacterium metallidurans TaxID=1482676 RepID=A0ABN0SL31_9MICO
MRIALHAFNDNPGSPALVFGGALGTRIPLWAAVASRLVDDHQIYLADLPGHTYPVPESELATDFTISDLASGLVESLEDRGVESFTYCGASISGGIGLTLALEHPHKLTGLVACSTAAKFGTDVSWAERITEVENDGTQSLLPDTADRWFAAGFLEEDIATGPLVLTDLATVDDAAYIACCRALALYDLEGRLGGITTPTLFMAGTQDPGCTPEAMGQLRDAVEGSELAVIPDSAHLPMAEHPEFVADRIHSFIAGL